MPSPDPTMGLHQVCCCSIDQRILGRTQPQKLAHEMRIVQDHTKRPIFPHPTNVELNNSQENDVIYSIFDLASGMGFLFRALTFYCLVN